MTEESLFLAALEKSVPAEREAFLKDACGTDVAQRARVQMLLEADARARGILDRPVQGKPEQTGAYIPREQPGAVIAGRYKLLEAIGEGGMGTVWVAEQIEPVRRKVALKLIKVGMDSKSVLARFEAERQALAVMDHPNIAKVLDGGIAGEPGALATGGGRPFFVMEYVKGVPITEYCDATRLSVPERLNLFVQVCQAVQHAHQKGIIHRDLKPSNILVAPYDDKPVPKVIDFGLAKAMHQSLTERTLHTAHETVLGTPLYMSPEQAQLNNLDVDTRSDIYSLGVLLYELLTGTTPLEKKRFKQAAWEEIKRIIREEDPPRPSTRLSSSHTLASLAAGRHSEPAKLTKLVRGELDWIVMKALEKDRARRYETANGFGADVQRFLTGEPVMAVPPSARYRLRKFARKHRTALTTTAAFVGLLVASVIVSSWLAVQAKRAEAIAEEKREEAEANGIEASLNLGRYHGAYHRAAMAQRDAVRMANSLQVDRDLAEMNQDQRVGLLRICRMLPGLMKSIDRIQPYPGVNRTDKTNWRWLDGDTGEFERTLGEFLTAAILVSGQEFAPLLPPITHDGQKVLTHFLSPNHQRLLTLGADGTARLWDIKTARQIAVLQQGNERILNCAFSSDGQTAFTEDETGVARFWEPAAGKLRAQIERRPNLYAEAVNHPKTTFDRADIDIDLWARSIGRSTCMIIGRDRLLTRRVVGKQRPDNPKIVDQEFAGPVELWDTMTGQLVARLDAPGRDIGAFQFLGEGQWVTTVEGESTELVFSAKDGRLISKLNHPAGEAVQEVAASPSGRRITTVTQVSTGKRRLRFWDTDSWRADATGITIVCDGSPWFGLKCWTDDLVTFSMTMETEQWAVYRAGRAERVAVLTGDLDLLPPAPELACLDDGEVWETRTWKRLMPAAGRKFHPSLAKFAADGRFVFSNYTAFGFNGPLLIDTLTDKQFKHLRNWRNANRFGYVPGFGSIYVEGQEYLAAIRLLPSSEHLDLPPALLDLWAQVVMRGELGPDGMFVKWKEPMWEKKRQELAAAPVPRPDLPFPGYVATDRLHWLRAEYESASDPEKPRLANELLRRAEGIGDNVEAIRWRAERAKYSPEQAAKPQTKK